MTASSEDEDMVEENMSFAKHFMTIVYLLVFIVGTPGNIWIIYKLIRARLWSTSSVQLTVSQRSRIYIFALACSDLILLMTLPASASYNFYGTWIFGPWPCYTILSVETFAKLFSVHLLTVMSLERYIIVCTKLRQVYRAWMSLLPLCIGTTAGVIVPSVFHFLYLCHSQLDPNDYPETWVCLPCMTDQVFNGFAQYTFFVGFIIPFVIMTICYILLVRKVKEKYRIRRAQTTTAANPGKEPRYMSEVRKSIWRIAVFHFACWAPYWAFTMLPQYISQIMSLMVTEGNSDGMQQSSELFIYCRLVANCLPYINAAGNWVLYALLNVDVRKHIHSHPKKKKAKFLVKLNPVNSSIN